MGVFRVYDRATGGLRLNVQGGGGTPSGHAIASIATQMGNYVKGKDKLIIHITDGSPNSHPTVAKAVERCQRDGIEVMTLSTWFPSKEMIDSYKGMVEHIHTMSDLETAIPNLLQKRITRRAAKV